jgi:hypothetical protein
MSNSPDNSNSVTPSAVESAKEQPIETPQTENPQPPPSPAMASGQTTAVPSPAVVSQIETVSPVQTSPVTARAPLAADIPLSDPPVESKVEMAPAPAQGMAYSSDPLSAPKPETRSPDPASALPNYPPRSYGAASSAAVPPKPRMPMMVKAVSAFVVLGAVSGVGLAIHNGMERARIENDVQALLNRADAAYIGNDVSGAWQRAQEAGKTISTSSQDLDAEKKTKWAAQIKQFNESKGEMDQLEAVFATVEKDLPGVRSKLENKKTLYGPLNKTNQPLIAKVDTLLEEVGKIELKRKLLKLNADLKTADGLYMDGKIEDAASKATEILAAMAEKPVLQDPDIEKRTSTLKKRAADFAAAKSERMKARTDTYSDVKNKLQARIAGLDEGNADLKPLVNRLVELKKDLIQEEKRSRKLKPEEAAELKAVVGELARRDKTITIGEVDGDTLELTFEGKPLRIGFQRTALSRSLFFEVEGNRYLVEAEDMFGRDPKQGGTGKPARARRVLTHALALGEAMKKAAVQSDDFWDARDEAPLLSARRTGDDGKEYIFLGDRLYTGKSMEKTATEKEVEAEFGKRAEALAVAVENDSASREDVRRVIAVAVRATYKNADWYDHLPGEFVRQVVAEGYIEANLPGTAERLKKELADYREAYGKISNPHPRFSGNSAVGDEAMEMRTYEDHAVWRLYDKAADQTSFAIKNPDDEKSSLFVLYDFPGKVAEFPADPKPKAVRMTHQAIGVTATWDAAADKLNVDRTVWDRAVSLEAPLLPDDFRTTKGYGPPAWSLPPHVLLVSQLGDTKSIITPYGRLDIQDFAKIADKAKRTEAMEQFLDKMAKVLPTADYLHLYFRYFFEYILDSPITSNTSLLGSRAHCGDIHQTAYQSLERLMGGRYVGDCDDLAEFFVNVTRRQQKLSYVMALPQHAACGWAEKQPGTDYFNFYVIDTGPPRMFKEKELDGVIEKAFRAYDEDKTMRFDPKSLGFLFRFNGEPTRTPYYLSSRMYTDRAYGEDMERVQSYWHFHFYALGIQTMTQMIEKGDRVPENCIELAGLYGQVREVESSIKWTNEALKQLSPEEKLSRMSEQFRIALMWREEHENLKAYDATKGMVDELNALHSDQHSMNYFSMRMQVMGLLLGIDRPWEAWNVVQRDMVVFARRGILKIEHAGSLTGVYKKMQDMIREGKQPTAVEKAELNKLEQLLTWFYGNALFEAEDDFNDYMRKYAFVGNWYAGKMGPQKLLEELLKPGPFPDPATPRKHDNRKDPEAEDWKWIRLSLHSYALAMGDALDLDDPPEKWRREEAVKLADAMFKAADQARKFGSLSSSEFQLLSTRVFRAFLVKDWADLEKVLAEVKERDWARLTSDISETFGRSARFVTPDEFETQFKMFTKYIKSRPSYFTVVYEAYRSEGIEHALRASKYSLECWPGDEDMKREAQYLDGLAKKKLEAKKNKPADKKDVPAESPVPKPVPPAPKVP